MWIRHKNRLINLNLLPGIECSGAQVFLGGAVGALAIDYQDSEQAKAAFEQINAALMAGKRYLDLSEQAKPV